MTLRLYMKSGNVIVLERIKSWEVKTTGYTITSLELEHERGGSFSKSVERCISSSLRLDQIEAITEEK